MVLHKTLETFGITDYLFIIALFFTFYIFKFYYKYFTRHNKLPGPIPLPIIECSYYFRGDLKKMITLLNKKYGDIYEIQLGGYRRIVLARPEYVEKFFNPSTKHLTFLSRIPYAQGLEEIGMIGKGLLMNNDFKSWRFNRQFFTQAILSPKFNNEAIKWTKILFEELEGYWKSLGEIGLSNDDTVWSLETDFSVWFHRFTNDMIVVQTTGERSYSMASHYNTLSPIKASHPDALIDDSDRFVKGISQHILGSPFFILMGSFIRNHVPFIKGKVKSLLKNRDYLFEKLDIIIMRRRKEIDDTQIGDELRHDMLTSLITANTVRDISNEKTVGGETFRPMNDVEIRANLLDAFLAGTDTTANLFSFITYYVCHHPQVKQRMIEEIDSIFSPNGSYQLTYDSLTKLKYCEAIIKEADRIMPVLNLMSRYSTDPCDIAGYQWPTGTVFLADLASIHLHKDYWHDPETFNPDRFYLDDASYLNAKFESIGVRETNINDKNIHNKIGHKHSFVMFGGGLRICPGRKLAMIELLSLMVLVFGKYYIELVDMKSPLKTQSSAITSCIELKVRIKLRNIKSTM